MNLSLKQRIASLFVLANVAVIVVACLVFHFLHGLNRDVDEISAQAMKISMLTDEVRISAVAILKHQHELIMSKHSETLVPKIISLCDGLMEQLQALNLILQDSTPKEILTKISTNVETLKMLLGKATIYVRDSRDSRLGLSAEELAYRILDEFAQFQDFQYLQAKENNEKMKKVVNRTKKNMMITLIIGFLTTIILALIAPGKISLPFKKIKDAIRELQDCNLDVSISYNQDDEVGEIAQEMNKMIRSFKTFDDLRADRINIENRKFDALANLSNRPVLLAGADGKLAYMNNFMFSLLQLKSEDIIGKDLKESILPAPLVDAFELAMKRHSKVENIEMAIHTREAEVVEVVGAEVSNPDELSKDSATGGKDAQEEGNLVYLGYANVIPIRAKESSLDYYLMVLSPEMFT